MEGLWQAALSLIGRGRNVNLMLTVWQHIISMAAVYVSRLRAALIVGNSMNAVSAASRSSSQHVLQFQSLDKSRPVFAFRCDAKGQVDLDQLSHRERNNYLYARVSIGREFAGPTIEIAEAV